MAKKTVKKKAKQQAASPGLSTLVSIVIGPVSEGETTRECLEALAAETRYVPYEVLLVAPDNAATDLIAPAGARAMRTIAAPPSPSGLGFNAAIAAAEGEHIVLLDPRVRVEAKWLPALLKTMARDSRIAAVGGRMLFPDGRLAHGGIAFEDEGGFIAKGRGGTGSYFAALQESDVEALDSGLLLLRRDALPAIGEFDERLGPLYGGIDLCRRAAAAGLRIVYCPKSVAVDGRPSRLSDGPASLPPERLLLEAGEVEAFYRKWTTAGSAPRTDLGRRIGGYWQGVRRSMESVLEHEGVPQPWAALAEADKAPATAAEPREGRIVFLSEHGRASAEATRFLLRLADRMAAAGYRTGVLNVGPQLGRPLWLVPPFLSLPEPQVIHQVLACDPDRPSLVAVGWRGVYHGLVERSTGGNEVYLLLDEIDTAGLQQLSDALLLARAVTSVGVLTHSPRLAEIVERVTGRAPAILPLPGSYTDAAPAATASSAEHFTVLFETTPDGRQAERTIVEAYRLAAREMPELRLHSMGFRASAKYGTLYEHTQLDWDRDERGKRAALFASAGCFVSCPAATGPHLAAAEAMAAGCPVIVPSAAAPHAGCLPDENALVVDSPDAGALAEAMKRLASDAALRSRLAEGGRAAARDHSWEAVLAALPPGLLRRGGSGPRRDLDGVWRSDDAA